MTSATREIQNQSVIGMPEYWCERYGSYTHCTAEKPIPICDIEPHKNSFSCRHSDAFGIIVLLTGLVCIIIFVCVICNVE